jgi:hypothetical protein
MSVRSLLLGLCLALLPSLAHAAAISGSMQESFIDYTDPTAFANITPPSSSQNGGLGWNTSGTATTNDTGASWGASLNAGVLRTVNSPGLSYSATGYLAPTGNKLTLDAASTNVGQNIGRSLGGQTIDTGSTYFSFLVSRNTADTIRTINLAFFNGTTERFAVGQIGAAAGNTAGNIALLMNNTNPGGIIPAATPIAMGNNITHLLVGRIDWNAAGNETVTLWVDLNDVTTEPLPGDLARPVYSSTNGFELTQITAIRPFVGNTAGGFNGVSANYDEIRIGGTWASVTSQPVAVPEPASILSGIFSVLGLGVMARRHRKS